MHILKKYYLSVDLINVKEDLNDLKHIYDYLDGVIANVLKLKSLHKPILIPYYYGKKEEDCGVSCYAFFAGGYLTLHIFEKRRIAYFDIVSDKKIDNKKVLTGLENFMGTSEYNIYDNQIENKVYNENIFGPHYFCFGKSKSSIDADSLLKLSELIINKIKMTPITHPVIVKDKNEMRVFTAIAESHICLTVFDKDLVVDVFSCKMFDISKLEKILSNYLEIENKRIYTRSNKVK